MKYTEEIVGQYDSRENAIKITSKAEVTVHTSLINTLY